MILSLSCAPTRPKDTAGGGCAWWVGLSVGRDREILRKDEGRVVRRGSQSNRKGTPHLNRSGRQRLGGRDMAYLAHRPGI